MEKDEPEDNDGQAPFGTLELGADVMNRARVVCVNVELDILEIRRIVEYVEYHATR